MSIMRGLVAVVVGYLLLAAAAMGVVGSLFANSKEPETGSIVLAIGSLVIGAIIAGFIATLITGTANHPAIYITLGVLILMVVRSFIQGQGIEPDWYRFVGTLSQAIGLLVGASVAAHRLEG